MTGLWNFRAVRHGLVLFVLACYAACDGGGGTGTALITPQTPDIKVGESVQLSATGATDWRTSNARVAVVSASGLVTGVDEGVATVTATIPRVGQADEQASAKITVLTQERPVIVLAQEPDPTHAEVEFVAVEGGSDPAPRRIEISNGGEAALTGLVASIIYNGGAAGWLGGEFSATSAPSIFTLQASVAGLRPGEYRAQIDIESPVAVNRVRVAVTLTVEPKPTIVLATESVELEAAVGSATPVQEVVRVTNGPSSFELTGLTTSVSYRAGDPTDWLAPSLSSTTAPADLRLVATPAQLPKGEYEATVSVSSPVASNSPQALRVRLIVADGPSISLSTSGVSFSAESVGGAVTPGSRAIAVSNGGIGQLTGLTAVVSFGATASDWVSADLGATSAPTTLTLTPNASGVPAGTHTATVVVASTMSGVAARAVSVTLRVGAADTLRPTNLQAVAVGSSVALSWDDNSQGESGFEIQRRLTGTTTWTDVTTVGLDVTDYTDASTAANTSYDYQVRACFPSTSCSDWADQVSVTTGTGGGVTIPTSPTNLVVTDTSTTSITMQWQDNSTDEVEFVIEEGGPTVSWTQIGSVPANTTTFTDTNVVSNPTIQYRVRACNSAGCSGSTNTVTLSVPATPTGASAGAVSSSEIAVTWQDGGAETWYEVDHRVQGGSTWTTQTRPANATSWNHTGLTASTTYEYQIRACSGLGCSTATGVVSAMTTSGGGVTIPTSPTNLVVTDTSTTSITMQWQDNSTDEVEFVIEEGGPTVSWTQIGSVPANTTTFTDTNVVSNPTIQYRVRACNSAGCSGSTNTVTLSVPATPTGASAGAVSSSEIAVTWQDGGAETWYEVDHRAQGGSTWTTQTRPANATSWNHTGLTASTTYEYQIRACNGLGCSAATGVVSATTTSGSSVTIPQSPTNLVVTGTSASAVALQWQDNSTDEVEFVIEEGGPTVSWAQIGTVPANTTTFTDTSVITDQTIQYRVRACNSAGCSGSTNTVTLTVSSSEPRSTIGIGLASQGGDADRSP